MTHGTHAGYYAHRRAKDTPCEPCLKAYRRWNKAWKVERQRTGPRIVPSDAVRARIAELRAAGLTLRTIGFAAGVSASTLSNLQHRPESGISKRIEEKILAVTVHDAMRSVHPDDEHFVPRSGAVRRVQALMALGWTHRHMRAHSGVITHVLLAQAGDLITIRNHQRIAAMYDALSMTPGPSSLTRARAARMGYLPPLAWDDDTIDDPAAWANVAGNDTDFILDGSPYYARIDVDEVAIERFITGDLHWSKLTRHERISAALLMDARGYSRNDIAARTRLNSRTLWDAFASGSSNVTRLASESGETIAS